MSGIRPTIIQTSENRRVGGSVPSLKSGTSAGILARKSVAQTEHRGRENTVPGMRRAVLDSNAVDLLIDLPGAYETLRTAVDDGRLRLLFTHINIDELAVVPDAERRSRLLLAMVDLGQLVPTGACVADVSRLNFARLMEDVDAVEALRSGNIDHTRDALIAATAIFEKCALVTNDKRLAGQARRGIEVLTTSKLLADYGFAQAA